MEVTFITTEVVCGQNGYGINFKGGSPVTIDTVQPSSPAEHGGLRFGDVLVELNGNDIFSFTKESLISTIKACNRSTLRVKVGRVRPIPLTAVDRKEAARLIKKKLESGGVQQVEQVQQYQNQLNNSMAEVADLLKSFDLPLPTPVSSKPPSSAQSSASRKSEEGGVIQELEVELYDDDGSLPSAPSSNSSDCDPAERDPLLDFTREDQLTHKSGSARNPVATRASPSSWQSDGTEGPQLLKATIDLQRGINNLKGILQTAERAYEEKQNKRRIELEAASATEPPRHTMTTASFPQDQKRTNRPQGFENLKGRTTSGAPQFTGDRTSDTHTQSQVVGSGPSTRSRDHRAEEQAVLSPTKKLPSPTKNASSNAHSGSGLKNRFTPPPPPPQVSSSSTATSSAHANAAMPSPATSSSSVSRQNSKPHSQVTKPAPYSGRMMSPKVSAKVQPAQVGSSEYVSRLSKGKSPEAVKDPWNDTAKGSERDWSKRRTPPPLQTSVTTTANVVKVASPSPRSSSSSTGNSRSPSMSPPPPPVPAYNPSQPDSFVLSNQKEYLMGEEKSRQSGAEGGRRETTRRNFDVAPVNHRAKKAVFKVAPVQEACNGLPRSVTDWSQEQVQLWLRQLSPSLSDLYGDVFSRHCIIGRNLLRLNITKLKKMSVDAKDSRLLANEIVNLKIWQEKLELEELNELSYL